MNDTVRREQHKKDLRIDVINQISEQCQQYQEYSRMHDTILEEHWDLNNHRLANTFYRIEELMKDRAIKIKKLSESLKP